MGIHGNATCQMVLDGAIGTLVGEPNKGLAAMFVMMNAARIGVGMQSLGLTEVAYQNALAYARDRVQSRSLTGVKQPELPADSILVHPDVRKMLLTARAFAEGGRALALYCAMLLDRETHHPDAEVRAAATQRVALLTPIVKAFLTDNAWLATSACLQVLGGHGYIREWGMEQFVRDARINMIYEGTNTIQSLDLLGRKVLGNQGATLQALGAEIQAFIDAQQGEAEMAEFVRPLATVMRQFSQLTAEIGQRARQDADEVGAAAVDYLRIAGHVVFAWLWARMARAALEGLARDDRDSFYRAKIETARFYYARLLPETAGLMQSARAGAAVLMDTQAVFA